MAILNTVAQFGRYMLRSRLATARACEVWLASVDGADPAAGPVVFKKLRPELAQNPSVVEVFTQRAHRAMQLNHECIARVLDVVVDRSECGCAVEFIDGITLRQLVAAVGNAGNALPVWFAIHVTRRICQALEHAHEGLLEPGEPQRILHENLGPENAFLTFSGQVKVTDFGLSHATLLPAPNPAPRDSTRPPESSDWEIQPSVVRSSVRHDLDSVGWVLYELLTGICPRSSTSPDVGYLPPSHYASWINADVDQLLSRILSPNDVKRFQTAGELRQALDEYLTSRRHDVTSTHVAGLLSVLFAPECHDSAPPTMRFQEAAAEVAQRRSRRTTPPEHQSSGFSATEIPTYNPIAHAGIQASPGSQRSRPTMPATLAGDQAKAKPVMESSTQPTAPRQHESTANGGATAGGDQDKGADGAEHRGGPFRHDWDLALKRAREEAQTAQRGSGNFPVDSSVARPAPVLDPIEQAVIEFERGLEHMRTGQFEQALAAWERALALDPQHRVCRANLSLLKKKLGSQI